MEAKGQKVFVAVPAGDDELEVMTKRALKFFKLRNKNIDDLKWDGDAVCLTSIDDLSKVVGPDAKTAGTLTEPREFNLMFKTYVGALSGEEGAAFMRPETAQGIFVNFKNVLDSTRHRLPLGICLLYTSPSPRDATLSRMPSSA